MRRWLHAAWVLLLTACGGEFHATSTPHGTPNLVEVAPNFWRMGEPPSEAAWQDVDRTVAPADSDKVLVVKLNDEAEGDDGYAKALGWTVATYAMPPEDDKPWTIVVKPDTEVVRHVVWQIDAALGLGWTVIVHCTHGRDRTGLIVALVGMKRYGWSKRKAWADMIAHGFRWELPDLDAYWLEDTK